MNYNYSDCLSYVKRNLKAHLYPYQEEMLKAFCEGKEVRCARGVGRSYVAKLFGQYVASLYDKNNYDKTPDIVFPYTCALNLGLIDRSFIDRVRKELPQETFERDFLCK